MSEANVRELHIMSILLNGERFGRQINLEYEKVTKKRMPIGSLYTTLERMQDKGYIKSREGEPNPEYGGNRRRYFSLTAKGRNVFDETTLAFNPLGVNRA
jgi:DNA-binding PadR family transcriptional regulator